MVGFYERRGPTETYRPYPLPLILNAEAFCRHYFSSGVALIHPRLYGADGDCLDLARLMYETYLTLIPFEPHHLGYAAGFAQGRALVIFDKTHGSLRLSGRLLEPEILEAVLELASQRVTRRAGGDVLEMLLASYRSHPVNPLSPNGSPKMEESEQQIIQPGSQGLNMKLGEWFRVEEVVQNEAGLCYWGITESHWQPAGQPIFDILHRERGAQNPRNKPNAETRAGLFGREITGWPHLEAIPLFIKSTYSFSKGKFTMLKRQNLFNLLDGFSLTLAILGILLAIFCLVKTLKKQSRQRMAMAVPPKPQNPVRLVGGLASLDFSPVQQEREGALPHWIRYYNLALNPLPEVAAVIISEAIQEGLSGKWEATDPGEVDQLAVALAYYHIFQYEPGYWMHESEYMADQAQLTLRECIREQVKAFSQKTGLPVNRLTPYLLSCHQKTRECFEFDLGIDLITGYPLTGEIGQADQITTLSLGTWTFYQTSNDDDKAGQLAELRVACEELMQSVAAAVREYSQTTVRSIEGVVLYPRPVSDSEDGGFDYSGRVDLDLGALLKELVTPVAQEEVGLRVEG